MRTQELTIQLFDLAVSEWESDSKHYEVDCYHKFAHGAESESRSKKAIDDSTI